MAETLRPAIPDIYGRVAPLPSRPYSRLRLREALRWRHVPLSARHGLRVHRCRTASGTPRPAYRRRATPRRPPRRPRCLKRTSIFVGAGGSRREWFFVTPAKAGIQSKEESGHWVGILAFGPPGGATFVSPKVAKSIVPSVAAARLWPWGSPAMLARNGPVGTRPARYIAPASNMPPCSPVAGCASRRASRHTPERVGAVAPAANWFFVIPAKAAIQNRTYPDKVGIQSLTGFRPAPE